MIFSNKEKSPHIPLYERGRRQFSFPLSQRGTKGDLASPSRSLAALLLGAWLFAPQAALAQSECGLQSDPGNPETITCDPQDYPDGITYDSLGDLTLEISNVSDDLRAFGNGVSVTGNGDDNITFDAGGFSLGNILNPDPGDAIIDYVSETGDITIIGTPLPDSDNRIGGGGSDAARAIRARSGLTTATVGDGGDIAIRGMWFFGRSAEAIEAVTDGGDINIIGPEDPQEGFAGDGWVSGPGGGIFAETGGAGLITINIGRVEGGAGGPAIHAVSDADVLITARRVSRGSDGAAILTETDGLVTVNVDDLITAEFGFPSQFGLAVQTIGSRAVVNAGGIHGGLDFSGLSDHAELHITADPLGEDERPDWLVRPDYPVNVFSGGDDLATVGAGRTLSLPVFGTGGIPTFSRSVTVDFGAGDDTLEIDGSIWVGPKSAGHNLLDNYEGELRLKSLENLQFAGTLWLGHFFSTSGGPRDFFRRTTDAWADDMLTAEGVHWNGSGDNRIELDVDLNHTSANGQTGCNDSFRNADGDFPSADCLNLAGGSATGKTFIKIKQRVPGDRGAYNPGGIVLVDLTGGDPADTDPRAFTVHPDSQQYSPAHGGIVDKGVFIYPIAFDAETQQFKIYGLPGPTGQQVPLVAHVTNELWRTSTDAWFDRRVDQRDVDLGAGTGGGAWFRATGREGERDVITPVIAGSTTLNFDNSYTQDDSALTFGADLISRGSGDTAWVVGGMIGYTRSRVSFDDSLNRANFEGVHAGVYGSAMFGDVFVDAAINRNWVGLDAAVPSVELKPEGTLLSTDATSTGAQLEAGWRWRMSDRLTIEPLAGLSYVESSFDKLTVPAGNPTRFGAAFRLDDPVSSRGSLGVRARMDNLLPGFAPTSVGLTARAIEEFDGEAEGSIANVGPLEAPVSDTFDGTFGQLTGDVSITNAAKTAAGYLKVDAVTGDDYDSLGVSAGFRYQW